MDNQSLFFIFGGLGLLLLVKYIFKSNSRLIKGWMGEFYVNCSAKYSLDKSTYHLIKNVTLPTEDSTAQIDHIIVSRYGIFVVETKNMSGWIFGSEHQKTWTQNLFGHNTKFQNPLNQNYGHMKALEEILGIVPDKIFSVIVFVGDSQFKTEMLPNVTYAKGYVGYIKSKTEPLFGEYEVQEIIDKIERYRLKPGFKTHFEHVENVKKKHPTRTSRTSRASGSFSPVTKTILAAIAFLVIATVVKNNYSDKTTTQEQLSSTSESTSHAEGQLPDNSSTQYHVKKSPPAQRKEDKIYAYKDEDGHTQFTNVGVPEAGQLVHDSSITNNQQDSLPIEISDNKIYIPVTIGHKGKQMSTSLLLEKDSNKTVLPKRIADFVNAENARVTSTHVIRGKVIQGDTIRVNYFNVGSVIENDFIITASRDNGYSRQGILGMDFIIRHPFTIDMQRKVLVWQ